MKRVSLVMVAAAVAAAGVVDAAELSGTVSLVRRGKPSRLGDLRDAVVWFEPKGKVEQPGLRQDPYVMTTKNKEFDPHVLVVRRGEKVRFPNQDPILHNVFSVSGKNSFDLGFYKTGPGETVTFQESGLVRVFCNVHHAMVAYVMVLDAPFSARPDADGRFRLSVPDGGGTLHVWHERSDPVSVPVAPGAAVIGKVELEVSRPRVPQHTNKHGQAYAPTSSYE